MSQILGLELYGPCSENKGIKPELGDTVAVITESGRVRVYEIVKVDVNLNGPVYYARGGIPLVASDCYLIYAVDVDAV